VARWKASPAIEALVRAYVASEPSFTVTFAVWDLRQQGNQISSYLFNVVLKPMIAAGEVRLIEDAGRFGKVYASTGQRPRLSELDEARRLRIVTAGTPERELDGRRVAYVTEAAREVK
jgi:hypothetical protein